MGNMRRLGESERRQGRRGSGPRTQASGLGDREGEKDSNWDTAGREEARKTNSSYSESVSLTGNGMMLLAVLACSPGPAL